MPKQARRLSVDDDSHGLGWTGRLLLCHRVISCSISRIYIPQTCYNLTVMNQNTATIMRGSNHHYSVVTNCIRNKHVNIYDQDTGLIWLESKLGVETHTHTHRKRPRCDAYLIAPSTWCSNRDSGNHTVCIINM